MVNKPNNFGVASLVLGIVSLVLFWVPIMGLISGIMGIVFYSKQRKIFSNGINTSGLVTSIIGTVLSTLYNLIYLFAIIFYTAAV